LIERDRCDALHESRRNHDVPRVAYIAAAALVVLTLILVIAGSWIPAIISALLAAAALWYVRQVRAVR
jgi:CHASE2 domain-containing sensor protein